MNNIEKYILQLYKNINITSFDLLSIGTMATIFDLEVFYWEFSSELVYYKGKYKMYINENLDYPGQWQDFGHEIKHYIFDEANQLQLPKQYVDYQEHKADYFAYHFCVPTFMLRKLKGVTVYDVMNLFNVEFEFALRRLEMYKNNIIVAAESKSVY